MTQYQYTIRAADDNEVLSSTCYAEDETVLRSDFKRMGYAVDFVAPVKASEVFGQRRRVKLQDLVSLCRRFSVMYEAGLPLLECLSSLAEENESKKLSDALHDIHDKIEGGSNVAEAFAKHPKVFTPLFVNLIHAGETAGKFNYMLGQLAGYIQREYDLKKKIKQALAYPLVVLAMIFVVVTIIMIVVVPSFSQVYLKLGVSLPAPTLILIAVSNNALYIFPSLIVFGVVSWFVCKKLQTVPVIKHWFDKVRLSLPLMGPVYHNIILLKFIRTLGIMVKAGIQLSDAITIAKKVANNAVVSEAANMIQRNIKRGGTITEAVRMHSFFPRVIVHAFSAGEEAGKLDDVLDSFGDGIEQEVDDGLKKLVTKIEPLLVVLLSVVVGFILLAIYMPIFDLMKALRG
ncbi:MAG: type II secretion system F family protein [Planctomycetes bacterium]|nr:type II secretion system F family protein [Planctomycetota bacterium]